MTSAFVRFWLLVFVIALSSSRAMAAPAAAYAVLETPATMTHKASSGAMLSVTRAERRLIAVGERGIILLSDDDGRHWRQAQVPVSVTLTSVQFLNGRLGWAAGHLGVVIHSNDGGETWIKQLDGVQVATLAQGAAASGTLGMADAKGLGEDGPDKPFLDIYFLNERVGFAVGAYNLIFRTSDGGSSWQPWQAHVDNPKGLHLYGIRSVGGGLFIVGEQGLVLRSTDGGDRFIALNSPYAGSFFGLFSDGPTSFIAYGLRANAFRFDARSGIWHRIDASGTVAFSGGAVLEDGTSVLLRQSGDLLLGCSERTAARQIAAGQPVPATHLAQASDGAIVISSLRGMLRVEPPKSY